MYRFDKKQLANQLSPLAANARAMVALGCAVRMSSLYEVLSSTTKIGDAGTLSRVQATAVRAFSGAAIGSHGLKGLIDACEKLVLDARSIEPSLLPEERAVLATISALRSALSNSTSDAIDAAAEAHTLTVEYALDVMNVAVIKNSKVIDQAESHPAVQAELSRQQRDITDVAAAGAGLDELSSLMFERAKVEAQSFLPDVSHFLPR